MYTLEQIFEALGKVENGGTMVADLQDAIRNAREEAAKSRIEKNKILDQLNLRQGDDVDGALKNLVATLAAVQSAGGDPSQLGVQMTELQKQVKELTDKYNASEEKAKAEHAKRVKAAIRSELISALTNGKAIQPEAMLKIIEGNVSIGDDDKAVYKVGDQSLSIEEGVKGWLKENPWAVKAEIQPGAGGGSQGGAGKMYSYEDLKGMSREEINAHWEDISKGISKGAEE